LQASGEDVVFCARGEQLRALKQQGLEIKSVQGDLKLRVKADRAPRRFCALRFAVKSYDTEAGAQQ
jgi:ketopantoate reductase